MVQIVESEDSFGSFVSESDLKNVSLNKGADFRVENRNNEATQCRIIVTSNGLLITIVILEFTNNTKCLSLF